jgi:chorismate synthase
MCVVSVCTTIQGGGMPVCTTIQAWRVVTRKMQLKMGMPGRVGVCVCVRACVCVLCVCACVCVCVCVCESEHH